MPSTRFLQAMIPAIPIRYPETAVRAFQFSPETDGRTIAGYADGHA